MSELIGRKIRVRALGKQGVIREIPRPGLFKVQIGSLSIMCRESDLVFEEDAPRKGAKPRAAQPSMGTRPVKRAPAPPPRMDFHGLRVEEATVKLAQYVSDAVMAGMDRLEIVHGIGTGRLKAAIHEALSSFSTVQSFKVDDGNPGVTVVYL